jgi:hypothetical protein
MSTMNGPSGLECKQFDLFAAIHAPLRTDDLKPGPLRLIGMRLIWEALWIIEEGEYAGQWAMRPLLSSDEGGWSWSPACDLKDAVAVDLRPVVTVERRVDGDTRADNAKLNPAYRP